MAPMRYVPLIECSATDCPSLVRSLKPRLCNPCKADTREGRRAATATRRGKRR